MKTKQKIQPEVARRALPALPSFGAVVGWALVAIFVGVSGVMSVSFGWSIGAPSGMGWPFAALALAVTGFKASALALTFGRGHNKAGCIALILLVPCFAYAVTAGHQFAAENLYKASNKTQAANTAYDATREKVDAIRADLKAIRETRDTAVIDGEIKRLLLTPGAEDCSTINGPVTKGICPKVAELRIALAMAEKRERLSGELPGLLKELNATPASSGVSHDAGPVAALAGRITGYEFASLEEFMAWLIVLIVELGDIIVPLVMTMIAKPAPAKLREQAKAEAARAERIVEDVRARQEAERELKTDRQIERDRQIAELQRFLNECTERDAGSTIKSSAFYTVYTTYAISVGEEPMKLQRFGDLLTNEIKLPKQKSGCWIYKGIKIKTGAWAKPRLKVASGG